MSVACCRSGRPRCAQEAARGLLPVALRHCVCVFAAATGRVCSCLRRSCGVQSRPFTRHPRWSRSLTGMHRTFATFVCVCRLRSCNAMCRAERTTPWTRPFDPSRPCQAMSGRHRSRTRSGQSWSPRDRALNSTARYGLTRRADSDCRATIAPGGVSIGAARGHSARKRNAGRPSLALPLERPRKTCRSLPSSMRRPVARQRPRYRTLARLFLRHARPSTSRLLALLKGARRRWVVRRSTADRVAAIRLQRLAAARSVHSGAVEDRRRTPEAAAARTPQRRPGPGSASPHP